MNISITLADGGALIVYEKNGAVWYQRLDASLRPVSHETKVTDFTSGDALWIGAAPSSSGSGYTIMWQAPGGGLFAQDYDNANQVTGAAHAITSVPADTGGLAFTSAENTPTIQIGGDTGTSGPVVLSAGGHATANADQGVLTISSTDASGQAMGPTYTLSGTFPHEYYSRAALTPLANGGYAAAYVHGTSASNFNIEVIRFGPNGYEQDQLLARQNPGGIAAIDELTITGLPDGGFVVAWGQAGPTMSTDGLYLQEFTADGQRVGQAQFLSDGTFTADAVQVLADGRYSVSWRDWFTGQDTTRSFTEAGASLGIRDPAPGGAANPPPTSPPPPPPPPGDSNSEHLVAVSAATVLTPSNGWSDAAVLSNHRLAVVATVDSGYGSHQAGEQTYDYTGAEAQSASLQGYAGSGQTLDPHITALNGGFYEVSYAGSTDYEIYNAKEQLVFSHNQYTCQTAAFTGLDNGGYVTTDTATGQYAVFDASNTAVGWFSIPADAAGTPVVTAEQGGGFVFTYGGSGHFDAFDSTGHLTVAGDLGASTSSFATAVAALDGGGFAEAWLSGDNGQNGAATSLRLQTFDVSGHATTAAIEVGQDLDPWHTQLALQSHPDGSMAVLWSQGGALWGAEYANGAAGEAHALGMAGSLADVRTIQLANDAVGLAWIENGDAWAEIFDPTTGTAHRVDLGASAGDLSTIHLLANASGGMAVSWHTASGVEGAMVSTAGELSTLPLPGDLLGVDGQGHAITLHDLNGSPVLQTYTGSENAFLGYYV